MTASDSNARYPVGRFEYDDNSSRNVIDSSISEIESLPKLLRAAVNGLNDEQLNTPYREGGWTPREVVHHVADSHMNAYVRCKLVLTEDTPTIKPYNQADWAKLADTKVVPITVSLDLLDALHVRWVTLLRSMSAADFERCYIHPEQQRRVPMREVAALYAWHGRHHTGHIVSLRAQKGWT